LGENRRRRVPIQYTDGLPACKIENIYVAKLRVMHIDYYI